MRSLAHLHHAKKQSMTAWAQFQRLHDYYNDEIARLIMGGVPARRRKRYPGLSGNSHQRRVAQRADARGRRVDRRAGDGAAAPEAPCSRSPGTGTA